jgi:predicted membrane protein
VTIALTVFAVTGSVILGYWLYLRLGRGTADASYDAIATLSAAFWIMAGIFAIMGGFVLFGSLLIVVFSYIGISKGKNTERRLRSKIAG